jgi:hypothetical protein
VVDPGPATPTAPAAPSSQEAGAEALTTVQTLLTLSADRTDGILFLDETPVLQPLPIERLGVEPGRHNLQMLLVDEGWLSEREPVVTRAGYRTAFRLRGFQEPPALLLGTPQAPPLRTPAPADAPATAPTEGSADDPALPHEGSAPGEAADRSQTPAPARPLIVVASGADAEAILLALTMPEPVAGPLDDSAPPVRPTPAVTAGMQWVSLQSSGPGRLFVDRRDSGLDTPVILEVEPGLVTFQLRFAGSGRLSSPLVMEAQADLHHHAFLEEGGRVWLR